MKFKVFSYQQQTWPLLVFSALASLGLVLLVAYFYLISQSVWQVVGSELLSRRQAEAQTVVANLEADYLHLASNFDFELAANLGLEETEETRFVSRVGRLSSNVGAGEL